MFENYIILFDIVHLPGFALWFPSMWSSFRWLANIHLVTKISIVNITELEYAEKTIIVGMYFIIF